MAARAGERIGIIYGEVEATTFQFAASDPGVKRLDYVTAQHPDGVALGQVLGVERRSQLSFDEAVSLGRSGPMVTGDQVSCHVKVIGYRDERGLLQVPRTPFKAGTEIRRATGELIQRVLGLTSRPDEGVFVGFLKGTEIPIVLDHETLVQKHVSVLAKTGAGKSYTVGVLIEELLKKRVPLVIIDPHGEYGTLANPNIEPSEIDNIIRFGLKPKSFAAQLTEYALEAGLVPGAKRLVLDGTNLEAHEVLDLLAGKVSSAQQGLLYQAINALKKTKPGYQLKDVGEELGRNPSNAKWPLVAALENLQSTGLFSAQGTGVADLVRAGHATLLNLKGAPPATQEIVVARMARSLFEARKRNAVPPFLLVVEEAHNFCPERGLGAAISGNELRTIASEGRKFGMGLLIVSQRPAKVDKNVVSQCNTQIIMKVTNPNDVKAIIASVEGLTSETADEIQGLETGVCLISGGALAMPVLVEVRTRQTRHGGKSASVVAEEENPPSGSEAISTPASDAESDAAEPFTNIEPAPAIPPEPVLSARAQKYSEPPASEPEPPVREIRKPPPTASAKNAPWAPQGALLESEPPAPPPPPSPRPPVRAHVPVPVVAPQPLPEPPTHVAPSMEPEELGVQRVLTRLGMESARSPREGILKVRELARTLPALSPDDYVRAFARLAQAYCYPTEPECGPCPLLSHCRLGRERLARGQVRLGRWGTRPR